LNSPEGLVIHPSGESLLIADRTNHVVRAVDLVTRTITRWAGTGTAASTGDGIDRLAASLNEPHGLARLPDGSVLISQFGGCRVTRITSAGITRQFAGTGTCATGAEGISALASQVGWPTAIAIDNSTGAGVTVHWADYQTQRVSCLGWWERERGGGRGMSADGFPNPRRDRACLVLR
jgi:hypothetical protein